MTTTWTVRAASLGMTAVAAMLALPLEAQTFEGFTPSRCAVAPAFLEPVARREDPDTAAFTPRGDTLRSTTIAALRTCEAIYGSLTSDERELLAAARVKLGLGADTAAESARRTYLTKLANRPVRERAWALYLAAYDLLAARPPRIAHARRIVDELDKLPVAEAGKARVLSHHLLSEAWRRQWDDIQADSQANVVIETWKQLPAARRSAIAFPLALAFLLRAEIRLRTMGIDAAKATVDTALTIVPENARQARYFVDITKQMYGALGKPGSPIQARFWFNTSDTTTPRPAKGRVTIISGSFHYCGMSCRDRHHAMGRLLARFGRDGLELINSTRTFGFFADTAPLSPLEEARRDSAYFLGTLRVPGLLAVAETKFTWLPDGRRRDEPTSQESNYPYASLIIVDKSGMVRYLALDWDPVMEEPLARLIEILLRT